VSHLNDPIFPANDREEDAPARCEILPPYTEHFPCGMPGCGKASTGKWAEPVFHVEVRGISPTWGGLETSVTRILICDGCHSGLGALATDAYMAEEERALSLLKADEE
jgi:hypothetical protein